MSDIAAMKLCLQCRETKPATQFYKRDNAGGLLSYCKPCNNMRSEDSRRKDSIGAMLHGVRCNAKKRGMECTLTREDIVIPLTCPVLGIPLRRAVRRMNDNSPSLDRLDSTIGYVSGNVKVISWKANRIKNNATLDELTKLVRWLKLEVA